MSERTWSIIEWTAVLTACGMILYVTFVSWWQEQKEKKRNKQ